MHGEDSYQALSADRKEHSGSQPAGAGDRSEVRGPPAFTPAGENVWAAWCGAVGSDLVRMDRAMRATTGAVISAAEAICAGLESSGHRRYTSERAGSEVATCAQRAHL